jgi:hypothetical protein
MELTVKRPRLDFRSGNPAPKEASMRHILMTVTALAVFTLSMSASMAQQPKQMDPGTIKVTPAPQTSPAPVQTQPAPIPNLNTSKNPYDQKKYMQTPVQQKK